MHKEANGDADGEGVNEGTSGVSATGATQDDAAAAEQARRKYAPWAPALALRIAQACDAMCDLMLLTMQLQQHCRLPHRCSSAVRLLSEAVNAWPAAGRTEVI